MVSTSSQEEANSHDKHKGMDIHNIDTDMHNTDMARDRCKKAQAVPDEQLRHTRKEDPTKAIFQLFSSLAISFRFMEDPLHFPGSLFKALDSTG